MTSACAGWTGSHPGGAGPALHARVASTCSSGSSCACDCARAPVEAGQRSAWTSWSWACCTRGRSAWPAPGRPARGDPALPGHAPVPWLQLGGAGRRLRGCRRRWSFLAAGEGRLRARPDRRGHALAWGAGGLARPAGPVAVYARAAAAGRCVPDRAACVRRVRARRSACSSSSPCRARCGCSAWSTELERSRGTPGRTGGGRGAAALLPRRPRRPGPAALHDRGPGRARRRPSPSAATRGRAEQILEVRETAHEALREARELARGYRPLDLHTEVEGAVSLLRSAGIAADRRPRRAARGVARAGGAGDPRGGHERAAALQRRPASR